MKFIRNHFVALFSLFFALYTIVLVLVFVSPSEIVEPPLNFFFLFLGMMVAYFLSEVFFPALRTWRPWIIAVRIAPFAFVAWTLWSQL